MTFPNEQSNPAAAIPVWSAPAPTAYLSGAAISFSTSGDNIVVAAVTGQVVKAYRLYIVAAGSTSITIKDGAGTNLTGAMPLAANGSLMMDLSALPWFTTTAGNALVINSSAAVQVSGRVEYTQA